MNRRRKDDEIAELRSTIAWIAKALPVLETMCRVAGLTAGQRKAREMLDYLASRPAQFRAPCPYWPGCGCGTQSGPHTCEWRR